MENISVEQLKSRTDAGENITVIDVREPHEYAEANLGAQLIPLGTLLAGDLSGIAVPKTQELVLQCRSGRRSADAALFLETQGFTNCKNLTGGILEWQEKFGSQKLR
jgi:rhodanese-related sulfurtransferase